MNSLTYVNLRLLDNCFKWKEMKQADPLGMRLRDFESLLCICEGNIVLIWLETKNLNL